MVNIKKTLGLRLRELRKRAGHKAVETLSERMGVHPSTVYEIERGENWLSPEMAEKYVSALNIPLGALFADSPVKVKPTPEEALEVLSDALAARKDHPLADLFRAMEGATPGQIEVIRNVLNLADQSENALKKR